MDKLIEDRIKKIFQSILGIKAEEVEGNSSPDTIPKWDSLQHMNLIVAIEEEFEIYFDDDEILKINNFSKILSKTSEKLSK